MGVFSYNKKHKPKRVVGTNTDFPLVRDWELWTVWLRTSSYREKT